MGLVVRRRHGESVKFGLKGALRPLIVITVEAPQYRGRIALIIDAPPDFVVLRGELESRQQPDPPPTLRIGRGH